MSIKSFLFVVPTFFLAISSSGFASNANDNIFEQKKTLPLGPLGGRLKLDALLPQPVCTILLPSSDRKARIAANEAKFSNAPVIRKQDPGLLPSSDRKARIAANEAKFSNAPGH